MKQKRTRIVLIETDFRNAKLEKLGHILEDLTSI